MGAGDCLILWGLVVVIVHGVLGNGWNVTYPVNPVCAVRGSSVVFPCQYDHPERYRVQTVIWCHDDQWCLNPPYVYISDNTDIKAEYRDRAEYLGNGENNCTLRIKNITDTDAGEYRFRLIANQKKEKFTGDPGVTLNVMELKVVTTSSGLNGTVREGDSVTLTCDTGSCSLSQSEFTWFKDNQPLPAKRPTLHINPVSYRHSGSYSCALKGYNRTVSDVILLDIQVTSNPKHLQIIGGILLSVFIACIVIIICIKRQNTDSLNEESERQGKNSTMEENEYSNVTESTISQMRKQKQEVSPQEQEVSPQEQEVCYASVQFTTEQPKKNCAAGKQASHDDTVIYSSVGKNTASHR